MVMRRIYLWIMIGCMAVMTACGEQKESAAESEISVTPSPVVTEAMQLPEVKKEDTLVLTKFPAKEDIAFTEGRHNRNAYLSRTFKTLEYQAGGSLFCVEACFSAEEAGDMVWKIITMLQNAEIWLGTPIHAPKQIVIVQSASGLSNSFCIDSTTVYIPESTIDSLTCAGALYEAAFPKVTEMWMRQGIAFLAEQKAQNEINEDAFQKDVKVLDSLEIPSLFGAYYYDEVNDIETIKQAQQIAASVILYVESEYGTEELQEWLCGKGNHTVQELCSEWMSQPWVKESGVSMNTSLLEGISYSASEEYDIVMKTDAYDISIVWVPEDAIEIRSVADLECFVYETIRTIDELATFLEEPVKESGNCLDQSYFHLIVDETNGSYAQRSSQTTQDTRTIRLSQYPGRALPHELVHLYTACNGAQWIGEGLAEYIQSILYPECYEYEGFLGYPLCDIRYAHMNECCKDKETYSEWMVSYWMQNGFIINDMNSFSPLLYHEGMAYAELKEQNGDVSKVIDEIKFLNKGSYDVYLCFVNYLIEKTSLSDVISVLYDETLFEEVFGVDFETLRAEWAEELLSKY